MSEEVYAPIIVTQMTITDALKQVFQISNANKQASKGFNEVTKSVLASRAIFVAMAKDYDQQRMTIVKKLCENHKIPIIEVDNRQSLASIVGFVKTNKDGDEVFGSCGVAALNDYCYETDEKLFIENHLRDLAMNQ